VAARRTGPAMVPNVAPTWGGHSLLPRPGAHRRAPSVRGGGGRGGGQLVGKALQMELGLLLGLILCSVVSKLL